MTELYSQFLPYTGTLDLAFCKRNYTDDEADINIPLSKAPQGEQVMDEEEKQEMQVMPWEEEVDEQEQVVRVLRRSNRNIKPPQDLASHTRRHSS